MPRTFPVIPIKEALFHMERIAKENNFPSDQQSLYNSLIKSCQTMKIGSHEVVEKELLKNFMLNFKYAMRSEDSSILRRERGLKVDKIVDVVEFIESPEYMNQAGHIRPVIKKELHKLFHESYYVEAVLGGAIGVGKNYMADMAMAYMLYCLSCYHNPQVEYDLAPGSSIVFIIQSKSLTLARKVAFDQFAARLRLSPYFTKYFPYDASIRSELRFPNGITILPAGGSDTAAIGMNIFGGILDELNFMARTSDSVMTRFTGDTEYDQAERLYETLIQRIKSRFMDKGKIPGKLLLISSANYVGDFTYRKRQEAKTDPTIFVMHYSQWEALPADRFSGERFLVETGSDIKQPRIIESMEEAVDPTDVITVPVEYRRDFERDIIQALKNFAGIESGASHPFIPQRELIKKAATDFVAMTGGRQLFMEETMCLNRVIDLNSPDWDLVVNEEYLEENILNKDQVFATHIDLSINKDACGIAIGHIMEYRELPEMTIYNPRMRDYVTVNDVMVPVYMIDGVLRVTAPPSGEIDYETIKRLILYIRGKINIKWGSLDFFQSQMMIQSFRRGGIKSGVMSIDKDIGPYSEVKSAIKDQRIYYPDHSVLLTELRELELDNIKGKVDHPSGGTAGSKDCSDAVAGTCYILFSKEAASHMRPTRRSLKTGTGDVRKIRFAARNSNTFRGSY